MAAVGISTFKRKDEPDILMASKIVIKEGCRPHRIVLRKLEPGKYVTHEETLVLVDGDTWAHESFNHGNYHEGYKTEAEALHEAVGDFNERAGRL
jgi:hypothetical protein